MGTAAAPPASMEANRASLDDFDALVALYWPGVFRFALASLRDRDRAATVAQDCFLRAWRSRERFRGDSSVRTWLMQIAVNLVRDEARSRKLQFWRSARAASGDFGALSATVADQGESPEAAASAREQLRAVWRAVRGLPERQRTVFLLRFTEEMELLEIAAATGMAEGTVKVHLFRALRAVREQVRQVSP
ncbi:MAG TPA: sigma-70 family RNA polymerase sigma factor [Bryobacteraceae bacterium]|nr:sigma-70 family RNA polymerase sigma factor [Bryobacteraceae bacterium]